MSFCFLFIAVACSMEDEKILSDIEQGIGDKENAAASIMVSFKGANATKGDDPTPPEKVLQNVVVFLLDENQEVENVLCVTDPTKLNSISFSTKKEDGKSVYVVANVSETTRNSLKVQKNLDAIKTVALTDEDLALLPKVSDEPKTVNFILDGDSFIATVTVSLIQRTSRIHLNQLTYQFVEGTVAYDDLKLVDISLANIVKDGQVEGISIIDPFSSYKEVPYVYEEGESSFPISAGSFVLADNIHFDTYANPEQLPGSKQMLTTLFLTFKMNSDKKTIKRICTIKTNGKELVEAGHIYELELNAIVSSGEIAVAVEARVLDWDYREIDLGGIEPE